jgi:hypothetical protein
MFESNASRCHAQLMRRRRLYGRRRLRSGELTAGCFAVTFPAELFGGTEAGVVVTNSQLCDAGFAVDVAARDGTISL